MNKLYNDTAVQAIANAIRSKNGSSDTYNIAEMSTALNDISYYAKPTISNVQLATFEADGLPLNSLKVSVEAKQAGSGVPSPDNVRPISGWDAVVVSDVDNVENPTVTQTTTISLPQTVYGGELDVVNGGGSSKFGLVDLSTLPWEYNADYNRFQTSFSGYKRPASNSEPMNAICSCFSVISSNGTASHSGNYGIGANAGSNILVARNENYTTAADFIASLTGQTLCYELATPTTFTTQPTPIKSLNGQNNLSVDCGEVIELEYFKEV